MTLNRILRWIAALLLVVASSSFLAALTSEETIYSFSGFPSDGSDPYGPMVFDSAGNLYGTTVRGGPSDHGTVFELTPIFGGVWARVILHSFSGSDGAYPTGLTMDSDGNLFGSTAGGASDMCEGGCGEIFELSPAGGGWSFAQIHTFFGLDGAVPRNAPAIDSKGDVFGSVGGYNGGNSIVFELTKQSDGEWKERVVKSYGGGGVYGSGVLPESVVIDKSDNLFVSALINLDSCQNAIVRCGVLFELSPQQNGTWTQSVVHLFSVPSLGGALSGFVIVPNGDIYGMTLVGGTLSDICPSGCGVVFRLALNAPGQWRETLLYSFDGTDSSTPYAAPTVDSVGNIYGTTSNFNRGTDCCGTAFKLSPNGVGGWNYNILHSFAGKPGGNLPESPVMIDAQGYLYSSASSGGPIANCRPSGGCGVIFEITP